MITSISTPTTAAIAPTINTPDAILGTLVSPGIGNDGVAVGVGVIVGVGVGVGVGAGVSSGKFKSKVLLFS